MNEITIVKRRTRLLPFLLTLLVVVLLLLAGLWMLGMLPGVAPATFDFAQGTRFDVPRLMDFGREAWSYFR
jgi:hypothetical protein